jgi:shikimate kinase
MQRILLTGISGTGKSTLSAALAARGYKAVDADTAAWSAWVAAGEVAGAAGTPVRPDADWVWRADRIRALLATEDAPILFLSGCAPNMGQFLPQFDHIVLLSAPPATLVARLATRTTNAYGKQPDEVARVLALQQTVEPLLRRAATHEIDTRLPLDQVVATLLHLIA